MEMMPGRGYLHELDEVLGCHWEASQETESLVVALAASQTALATVEEGSATWAHLADSDTRVAGRIFRRNPVPLSFCFVMLFLMVLSLSFSLP